MEQANPTMLLTWPREAEAVPDFEGALRQHQGMVFSIAYHFLQNRGQAEEVGQEVFLRLSSRLETLDSPRHLLLWLRRVTTRLSIDELRRRPGRQALALDEVAEPAADPTHGDPLEAAHLQRLVGALPDKARMTLILRYQEEMEPGEIAAVLKESVHTIKSRLQRSLETLREGMQRLTGGQRP